MDTQNPIEEGILKLVEKGYSANDVYNIMTQIGWIPEEVQLSMNQIYERRAKENEDIARQRQEAIDKINASYEDLKKKAEPQQSDSFFGTFPGEPSVELDALDELDSQVLSNVAKSNMLGNINNGASALMKSIEELNELKSSIDDPSIPSEQRRSAEKRIQSLENSIQAKYDNMRSDFSNASAMGVDLNWNLSLDLDQEKVDTNPYRDLIVETHMAERKESDAIRDLGSSAASAYKEFMGVDFPEIESIGDLNDQLITMSFNRGLDRARIEDESYGDPYEDYNIEDYENSLEDQSMIGSMGRQFGSMLGGIFSGNAQFLLDLGEYINENRHLKYISPNLANLGMLQQLSEGINRTTGFDTKAELLDYKRRLRAEDAARSRARDKELWENPVFWGKGMTERDEIILEQLNSGAISTTDAIELFATNLYQGIENTLPSAVYYGGLSMMGPGGIGAVVGSAGSAKYGDLNLDRPDLSFGEKVVISGVVGGVEGVVNRFFRGAEKMVLSPAMRTIAPAAIREMGKKAVRQGAASRFFQNNALGSILGEGAEEGIAYLAELGITNAVDAAAGRETERFSMYELLDQVQAGMLGGGVFAGAGSLVKSVANRGHYETRNRKLYLQKASSELRQKINSMPYGAERQELRRQLYNLNQEYRDLSAQEVLTYGKFSAQDRSKIAKLNREIAFVEDMIKYKRDAAGIRLNKDQLDALETRLSEAMDLKKSIESKYDSVDKTASEFSKEEKTTAEDVNGNEVETKSKRKPKAESQKKKQEAKQPAENDAESKKAAVAAEFDETKAEEAPAEEAPATEETLTEETATEEAPATEQMPAAETVDVSGEAYEVSRDPETGEVTGVVKKSTGRKAKAGSKNYNAAVEASSPKQQTEAQPAETEAPVEAQPAPQERTEADVISEGIDIDTKKGLDLADRDTVGEGEGKFSIDAASALGRLVKSFDLMLEKTGTKVIGLSRAKFDELAQMRNPEAFIAIKNQGDEIGGFYDVVGNRIILPTDSRASDIQEEFAHAMFLPIINGRANPEVQTKLYNELMDTIEDVRKSNPESKFVKDMDDRKKSYEAIKDELKRREEMIMGYLLGYKNHRKELQPKSGRIRQIINSAFKALGQRGPLVLKTDSDLNALAEAMVAASEGRTVDVEATQEQVQEAQQRARTPFSPDDLKQRKGESDAEYAQRLEDMVTEVTGMKTGEQVSREEGTQEGEVDQEPSIDDLFSIRGRKNFDYLKDTEVFYTHYPTIGAEDIITVSSKYSTPGFQKSVKVNDYFHFRNWYNKETGNQRATRVTDMFYIDKNGVARNIKPPKPKVDRDGKAVYMQIPMSGHQRKVAKARQAESRQIERLEKANEISRQASATWRRLPWHSMTNFDDFAPRLPERTKYRDLTSFDKIRYKEIQRENLMLAERLNMSREDFENVAIEDGAVVRGETLGMRNLSKGVSPAAHPEIFQASNQQLSEEANDGESIGDLFAIRKSRPAVEDGKTGHVMTDAQMKEGGFQEGDLSEVEDAVILRVFAYDRSLASMFKRVFSGIRAWSKPMPVRDIPGKSVLSTHVNSKMVEAEITVLTRAALKHLEETGNTKGKISVGISPLSRKNVFRNPDVFKSITDTIAFAVSKNPNKFRFDAARFLKKHYPKISQAVENSRGAISLSPESQEVIRSNKQDSKYISDEVIIELLQFMGNNNELMNRAEGDTTFDLREKILDEKVVDLFFEAYKVKYPGSRIPKKQAKRKDDKVFRVAEFFNDPLFLKQKHGTLVGYKNFEYELVEDPGGTRFRDKDGKSWKIKGLSSHMIKPGQAGQVGQFRFALIADSESVGRGKILKEQPYIETISTEYESVSRSEMRSKGKAGYTIKQEYGPNQDVGDMTSIRPKMQKVETDQGTFEMSDLTGFQRWRNLWIRRLVDKYNDIFDIQKAIESQAGRVSQSMDFKMKEELMYGKAAEELLKLDKKVDEIKKIMKKDGVSLSEINDYLYALHVPERNRVIKQRIEEENEERAKQKKKLKPVSEAGSGKTNQWAEETLASFSGSKNAALEKIAKKVRDIQDNTRSTMVGFGLESEETIQAWNDMFDSYVPLAGIALDEESSATTSYPTGGAGLSVFGPMTKRAKGRKSAAENILAQVIAQNAATHVKSRTNEAVRSLYDLAEANPNPRVWEVLDEANSIDPHVVSVRVDGEQKFIRFRDASNAEALRNMNLPETNLFLKILRAPSNWLRKSFTTLNPEFVVSNFARDIQTAVFNAAAEADIEGGILNGEKVMGDIIKSVPSTLKSLLRGQFGREQDAEMKRYYEDFKEDGAKTGWAYTKSLSDIAADLESEVSETTGMQKILGVGKNVVDFVEGLNEAFEDATRLAAYVAARKNGVSREKAAQLAKNITVNFNKHGEWGQALNGVYLFFNASVQGTARMFKTVGTLKPVTKPDGSSREWYERANNAQKMAAGLTLFSAMVSMLNAALSDEDEDDVLFYDKIPDYVKERNLIIMNPRDGKTYYKIPLPYGFNFFSNMGTVAADVSRGGMDADEGIYFLGQALVNAFSPISFGQSESLGRSLAKGGIPTVAKPFFDAWGFNETYFGGPVAAEQLPFGTKRPESSMSFRSPESVKSWFAWMNEVTGGSDRVPGSVDINPDRMWYVFEYFIGGAGNFVNRTGKTIRSVQGKFKDSDYDIAINDIPFARIMYGEQSRYYDHGKYRDNETKVKQLFLELKDTRDFNNPRYEGIVELNNLIKYSEKRLKALRDNRRKARQIKDWTRRSIEVQKIMDEERIIIMNFNKRYNELRKD